MTHDRPAGDPSPGEITERLLALREAGAEAWESLVPLVYDELRALAHRHLRQEPHMSLLDTSDLVHEAYFKLVDQTRVDWQDRSHFFAVASMVIRRILVNSAHQRRAVKRGGGFRRLPLDESVLPAISEERAEMLIALDEALTRLGSADERLQRVVECRFFGGLSNDEVAAVLSISARTVKRDWRAARAWLFRELGDLSGL
jgi:RNA polymerase sigma factor (TIGR02999 family)